MRKFITWFSAAKGKGSGFSLLSVGNLMIALITYLRFAEVARMFGTSWQTDAVSIAMVVPLLLQQLISTAFGVAFLPIYSRVMLRDGIDGGNRLVSRIINWMILLGALLIVASLLSGTTLVRLIGPGAERSTLNLAARLFYIFLPLVFLNAIEGVLQNFLNYYKRYGLVSFLRVLQILVSYIVLLAGHQRMGIMIIPVSGLAGAFVSFITCSAMTLHYKLRLHMMIDPKDRDFRELVKLAGPILIGTITGFLGPVADKVLASFLRSSSVTAIDYASRIRNLIRIVLIQPVIVLSTVSLSRIAAEGNTGDIRRELASYIRNISYYSIPISGILVMLSAPLISLLFQKGNFGPSDSMRVGYALAFYSPWFSQLGISLLMRRAFFALKESITPVVMGVWGMVVNILLNFILIEPLGIGGLALATTISGCMKTVLLAYFLRKRLGGLESRNFIPELVRILIGTSVTVGWILLMGATVPFNFEASLLSRFLNLSLKVLPGLMLFFLTTIVCGSRTAGNLIGMCRRVLAGRGRRS